MLLSTSLATLINGVSQQAQNLRYSSQCDEQENAFSSVLAGLQKRPNTRHVAPLPLADVPFVSEVMNRSETEQHTLIIGDRLLRVFNLDGSEVPIKNAAGGPLTSADLAYLQTASPTTALTALTVADYTVVLNREKVAALSTTVSPVPVPAAMLFCKQLRRGADYSITLSGSGGSSFSFSLDSVETDISASPAVGPVVEDQTAVVKRLDALIGANSAADALYSHYASDAVLYLKRNDGADFTVSVSCSIPEGFTALKDATQAFTDLPKKAVNGFSIKVVGSPEDTGDEYYVRFSATAPSTALGVICEGSWEEAQAGGLRDAINPATMPHSLLNFGTYFQFKSLSWTPRSAGDDDTNSAPSFIGRTIREVFFEKNRLGFLTDENAVLSEESEFWNFWRTSVIQLLDSDPIDVGASHSRVSLLNAAVATSERLVLFSEETQFVLSSDGILTPKSAVIKQAADYANITTVRPRAVGNSVFFPFKHGSYSGFAEFYVSTDTGLFVADNATEHVPNYLKGTVTAFSISDKANLLLASTDSDPNTLYAYHYFKQGTQRLQSAWGKWTFSGAVRGFFTLGTMLYVIIKRGSSFHFETVELSPGFRDAYSDYVTLLDRRITEAQTTVVYDAVHDYTTFTLPYSPTAGTACIARRATATTASGSTLSHSAPTPTTLRVSGDLRGVPLWLGETYTMAYTMSRPQLRANSYNGIQVVVPGRFQVRYGELAYAQSLYFRVEVTPKGRRAFTYPFSPQVSGTLSAISGTSPAPQDGVKKFAVNSKNDQVTIKIINDSPLPCALLSCDWTALYTAVATRS